MHEGLAKKACGKRLDFLSSLWLPSPRQSWDSGPFFCANSIPCFNRKKATFPGLIRDCRSLPFRPRDTNSYSRSTGVTCDSIILFQLWHASLSRAKLGGRPEIVIKDSLKTASVKKQTRTASTVRQKSPKKLKKGVKKGSHLHLETNWGCDICSY